MTLSKSKGSRSKSSAGPCWLRSALLTVKPPAPSLVAEVSCMIQLIHSTEQLCTSVSHAITHDTMKWECAVLRVMHHCDGSFEQQMQSLVSVTSAFSHRLFRLCSSHQEQCTCLCADVCLGCYDFTSLCVEASFLINQLFLLSAKVVFTLRQTTGLYTSCDVYLLDTSRACLVAFSLSPCWARSGVPVQRWCEQRWKRRYTCTNNELGVDSSSPEWWFTALHGQALPPWRG